VLRDNIVRRNLPADSPDSAFQQFWFCFQFRFFKTK
jgi:hypothetical protein